MREVARFGKQLRRALARDTPAFSGRPAVGPKLRGANLNGADLGGANLDGADLRGATLSAARMQKANLRNANLHNADLGAANLRDADLTGANLDGANLVDVDLLHSVWSRATRWPSGFGSAVENESEEIGHGVFRVVSGNAPS
jgi:uncharacterized protein YjbI with pentapeptide repeats